MVHSLEGTRREEIEFKCLERAPLLPCGTPALLTMEALPLVK